MGVLSMPIKALQSNRQAQFPIIGKLRKGSPQVEKSGKMVLGRDLDHFRFDSDDVSAVGVFTSAYGAQPKSIRVLLPFATVDQNFQAWMEEYSASGLQRRCDGESQSFHRDARGVGLTTPTPCAKACGSSCLCKQVGRLYVLIPELARLAYVIVETHSIYDIIQLTENLNAAFALRGNLAGVPFVLSRREREISTPGKEPGKRFRATKSLLFIEPDPEWVERKLVAMRTEAFAMLPEVSSAAPTNGTTRVDYATGEIIVEGSYIDPEDSEGSEDAGEKNPFDDPSVGANPARERLSRKVSTLFGEQSATAILWLVGSYTRQKTPDNIRDDMLKLSNDEVDAISDSIAKQKPETLKQAFANYLANRGESSGK